jgi:DNA-binding response OmpR family regulator
MAEATIAVVNNDTDFLNLMEELLRLEGYNTIICREGDRAYELMKQVQPDLIVLDIRLEHAETGWTILECLRLDPATTAIPVIVCSADSAFLRDKALSLQQLRCDILEKPFDLDMLLAKAAHSLERYPPSGAV